MRKGWLFGLAMLVAVGLAILATTPPAPLSYSAASTVFSAARAMRDVQLIASEPHVTGTAESLQVIDIIIKRMTDLGMEVSTQQGTIDARGTAKRNSWTGRADPPATLTNLIGILPGKDRKLPAVLLMAHHDTVWGSPGAADDTAGVAAALEVIRALRTQGPPQRDLVLLLTDGEELGLQGARKFFAQAPLRSHVGVVINMEARGGGGRTTLFQTSHQNGAAVRLYADAVRRPGASSLSAFVYSVLPNDTDLTPVIQGPYVAYNFAFIGRPGLYHSPKATPERLDQGSLQDMGGQVLDLTRALLSAPQLPAKAADAVFFDAFGLTTITYPVWLGWIMLALSLGGFGLVLRRDGTAGLGSGAGRMGGLLALAGLLLFALNRLSLGLGPSNYYDRLAAIPRLEVIAALACAAAYLLAFGAWKPARGAIVGAALPLLVLGAVAQFAAPTAAYVIVLPALLVALGLCVPGAWSKAAVAALVAGYMLGLGHQLMQGVGPTMPMAAALPLGLAGLALLPLWPRLSQRNARAAAVGLLVAAAAVALWVQMDPPADTRAVYSDSKT